MDEHAAQFLAPVSWASIEFLEKVKAPVTALATGHAPWAKIAKKPQKTVRLSKNGLTGKSEKPLFRIQGAKLRNPDSGPNKPACAELRHGFRLW